MILYAEMAGQQSVWVSIPPLSSVSDYTVRLRPSLLQLVTPLPGSPVSALPSQLSLAAPGTRS